MVRFRRRVVRERAAYRWEYCRLPERCSVLPHEIDHIRAKKHRGPTDLHNTCLACAYCNGAKGTNPAGFDPDTEALVALFNPRSDVWEDHFAWDDAVLVGLTPIGRATIDVLRINEPDRIEHRRLIIKAGDWR